MSGMDDLNGGVFHGGSFFFFFGVRGGNKGERERKKHPQPNPNTEIKFGEGEKTPRIFSFLKKRKEK